MGCVTLQSYGSHVGWSCGCFTPLGNSAFLSSGRSLSFFLSFLLSLFLSYHSSYSFTFTFTLSCFCILFLFCICVTSMTSDFRFLEWFTFHLVHFVPFILSFFHFPFFTPTVLRCGECQRRELSGSLVTVLDVCFVCQNTNLRFGDMSQEM